VPEVVLALLDAAAFEAELELLADVVLEFDEDEPHALSAIATEQDAATIAAAREVREPVPDRNGVKRNMISSPCASRAL
jgi:hypothetical protein